MDSNDKEEILEAIASLATHMDQRFDRVYAEMATKDFVDRRIAASEDRMVAEIHKVDAKVGTLASILEQKTVITADEADIVTA